MEKPVERDAVLVARSVPIHTLKLCAAGEERGERPGWEEKLAQSADKYALHKVRLQEEKFGRSSWQG